MNNQEDRNVAKAWVSLQYAERNSPEFDSLFWAHMRLDEILDNDAEHCWQIINEIREIDSSDFLLSNLAAGPLEDLLARSGGAFIERIEKLAQKDEKFRRLLAGLWKNNIPDEIWARVQGAI
jgi:hypothetical protein